MGFLLMIYPDFGYTDHIPNLSLNNYPIINQFLLNSLFL